MDGTKITWEITRVVNCFVNYDDKKCSTDTLIRVVIVFMPLNILNNWQGQDKIARSISGIPLYGLD